MALQYDGGGKMQRLTSVHLEKEYSTREGVKSVRINGTVASPPARREDPETTASIDSVGRDVCVVNGEDGRQPFASGQMYQRCIRKIHLAIGVS